MDSIPPREQLAQYYQRVFETLKRRYPEFDPLSAEVFISLLRTGDQFRALMERRCRQKGLTGPAFGILNLLDTHPEGRLSMREISQQMLVTQANMTGLVDTLEKLGFVKRGRDSKDRRVFRIEITTAGRKKLDAFRPGHFKFIRQFLSGFSDSEKKNLVHLMGKVRTSIVTASKAALLLILASGFLQAASFTLGAAAREAIGASPEVRRAYLDFEKAKLEEPGLLALTDPVFGVAASETDDRSPRSAPAFQGTFSKSKDMEASIRQDLLIGTETRLFFKTQKLENPSLFRPIDPTNTTSLGLEIRQPLLRYFWGRPDKAKRRQARAGVSAAEAALKRATEQEAARTMLAFVEAYIAQQNIAIREAAVEDARKLLANYKEKRRYGLVDASDSLQAEVALRTQETELRLARSHLERAGQSLRRALYRKEETPFETLELPAPPKRAIPPMEEAWSQAANSRGDYLAAKLLVERAESRLRAEALSTLPDLAVFGSYSYNGLNSRFSPSWKQAREGDFPIYTTGIQLEIPFLWKKEKIKRRQAGLDLEAAKAHRDILEADVRREVSQALEDLHLAQEREAAYEELLKLERRKLAAAEEDFQRGRFSTDLLIRFQGDIHRTETLLIQAKAEALAGWARLGFAMGNLIEGFTDLTGEAIQP